MAKTKVYVDFHNANSSGRIRLNCIETVEDLSRQQVELREGLMLTLYSDDLDDKGRLDEMLVDGVVSFSAEDHYWVAAVNWSAFRHASDDQKNCADSNGHSSPRPSGSVGHTGTRPLNVD